jgi:hypothetical protein
MAATNPPTLPPVESSDSGFNPNFDAPTPNGNGHVDVAPTSPTQAGPPAPAVQPLEKQPDAPNPAIQEQVQKVLYSDIGVNTLLNRLKASIASARVGAQLLIPNDHL